LDQSDVMIPGRVLEVVNREVCFGVQFLFMVGLGGFMGGRAAPGGNPRGDDFAPKVAALKLVGQRKNMPNMDWVMASLFVSLAIMKKV
jgi:hypothetical protein